MSPELVRAGARRHFDTRDPEAEQHQAAQDVAPPWSCQKGRRPRPRLLRVQPSGQHDTRNSEPRQDGNQREYGPTGKNREEGDENRPGGQEDECERSKRKPRSPGC